MSVASISERARSMVQEIPERERPISEEYRIAAREWVDAEKAASLLEETKTAVLSQMMNRLPDLSVNRAEMQVKASAEWMQFLKDMVEARAAANLAKVKMKWTELRFSEWQSADANARKERQMGRQAT